MSEEQGNCTGATCCGYIVGTYPDGHFEGGDIGNFWFYNVELSETLLTGLRALTLSRLPASSRFFESKTFSVTFDDLTGTVYFDTELEDGNAGTQRTWAIDQERIRLTVGQAVDLFRELGLPRVKPVLWHPIWYKMHDYEPSEQAICVSKYEIARDTINNPYVVQKTESGQ